MWKISSVVVESILAGSANTHPNEFASLLGGNGKTKTVGELIIVPAIFGEEHALLRTDLLPLNIPIVGSVHSHPGYSARPSNADAHLFARFGRFHLIVCEPFSIRTLRAYDENAKPQKFEIV